MPNSVTLKQIEGLAQWNRNMPLQLFVDNIILNSEFWSLIMPSPLPCPCPHPLPLPLYHHPPPCSRERVKLTTGLQAALASLQKRKAAIRATVRECDEAQGLTSIPQERFCGKVGLHGSAWVYMGLHGASWD